MRQLEHACGALTRSLWPDFSSPHHVLPHRVPRLHDRGLPLGGWLTPFNPVTGVALLVWFAALWLAGAAALAMVALLLRAVL